jgi:mRNA-degrading endonuclease RelE of RelBE toxin-antitoxin system
MVIVDFGSSFEKTFKKIKNLSLKDKLKKQIGKILKSPEIGKPMRYSRKGTRELYVAPYRLSYLYLEKENKIIFLELYHKDLQ